MRPFTFTSPDVEAETILTALEAAGFELAARTDCRRTVLDSFDGRLHRAGLRLELREDGHGTLVLSGAETAPAAVPVGTCPQRAADLPPGPFRRRLDAVLEVRALLPQLVVTATRTVATRRDPAGKELVAVDVHDDVDTGAGWLGGIRTAAEVRGLVGYDDAARDAAAVLDRLHLARHDGDLVDVVAETAGVDLAGNDGSPAVRLRRKEPAIDGFRRVLTRLADTIDDNWEGTVDDVDPEFLHDLRVAVRRTRSVLAQGRRVLPDEARRTFRDGFRWLGAVTSPARDLDVYVIEWDRYTSTLPRPVAHALDPVLRQILARRRTVHDGLRRDLESTRYVELIGSWRAWLADGDGDGTAGRDSRRPLGDVVARRIADAQDAVLRQGRSITSQSAASELHELRKDAKQLRYLLECFGGVLEREPRRVFVQRLKELQDNLGEHQDTEIHVDHLRALFDELHRAGAVAPDTLLAMGRLTEQLDRRRALAREEFAERFAAYDTKATAKALDALLRSASTR